MTTTIADAINTYLSSGEHDPLADVWLGESVFERCRGADTALREALVAEVLARTRRVRAPRRVNEAELEAVTRARVTPMVNGLFAANERATVTVVLARSVVFLTPRNMAAILRSEVYLSTAWNLANLYLLSCGARLLSKEALKIIGLSQATTCFVSMRYLDGEGRFDDVVLHEAAHIFHNCKRERIGLPSTRRREWLLDIAFGKRETFAYACEALGRIHELGATQRERAKLLAEHADGHLPVDESVDSDEYIDILREAVSARNGWRRILQRCAPPKRPAQARERPFSAHCE